MSCMVTGRAFECGGDDGDERRLGEALLSKDPVKEMSSSCSFCCLPLDDDENKPFILQLDTILSSCIQSMKCRAAAVEREKMKHRIYGVARSNLTRGRQPMTSTCVDKHVCEKRQTMIHDATCSQPTIKPMGLRMWMIAVVIFVTLVSRTRAFTPTTKVIAPTASRRSFLAAAATVDKTPFTDTTLSSGQDDIDKDNAFNLIAGRAAACLLQSDIRRDAVGEPGGTQASSATNWINDASAFALQKAINKMELKLADERTGLDRDEASTWIRWMKSSPTTMIIDLSPNLREIANTTISDASLELLDTSRDKFLNRMGCRLLLFPSGASLKSPLTEPPASIIYGKLLFGGVTRYRMLVSSNSQRASRRVGDRTEIKASVRDHVPVWMQYGGPDRQYEAVDMGAAAILEVLLLPIGQELESIAKQATGDMTASHIMWPPQKMFDFATNSDSISDANDDELLTGNTPMSLSGKGRNDAFTSDFQSAVGGLQPQIDAIVRRVLDGRVIRPADVDEKEEDGTTAELALASMESEELAILGLTPVRGLLLYGPPGCGKTQLAREISRSLRARAPKIVSAPELLDRW